MGKSYRRPPEDRNVVYERARKAAADALHELYASRSEAKADSELQAILDDIAEQNAQLEGDDPPDG